jgi:hypothetical protein
MDLAMVAAPLLVLNASDAAETSTKSASSDAAANDRRFLCGVKRE